MTNQRANGTLSISVSLKLLVLALVVTGLTSWLTLAGRTSPLPSNSVPGAKATFLTEADESARPGASTLATPDRGSYARVRDAYGKLPLQFEANAGQTDASVKFLSRSGGASLFLTSTEAVLVLRRTPDHDNGIPGPAADRHLEDENGIDRGSKANEVRRESHSPQAAGVAQDSVLRMKFVGANLLPRVEGAEQLPGYVNYFIGNDPAKWRTGIPTYARVRYEGVYPGVDVAYYGNQNQLEYDLMVAPGANPDVIKLRYDGLKSIRVDHDGNLTLITKAGEIRQDKPEVYQCIQGVRKNVETSYVKRGKNEVGFKVSRYDRRQPLVIDPILTYSTYLGGNGSDQGLGIAVDSAGNAYVTGSVGSGNFPTQNPIQTAQTGGDVFVAKLNGAGNALVYSTYLGGATLDQGNGIAVDASGNAYVTGRTDSFNFPTVAAIQSAKSGSPFFKSINGGTNWSSSATSLAGANVRDVAINPASPATIYSSTEIGVFKSTNSGGNWSATGLFNILIEALAIDPVTTTTLFAGGTGGVYKSTDAGNTWSSINNGLLVSNSVVPFVNAIVVDPTNTATLYAGASSGGGVFKSTNGGANWTAVNSGLTFVSGTSTFVPTVNGLTFDPVNPATLYASTTSGGVYKSSNGGGIWSAINNGLGTFPTVNVLVIDGTNPATLYAATFSGVFKSTDGGSNWSAATNGLTNFAINALAIDPTSPLAIYAGTSAGIFKSLNGGSNWNPITNGLTTVNINALTIDKTTPANVYAAANSSGDTFVTKLNTTGSALVYSSYLGGFEFDQGNGIAVDTSNNAYVTGETLSANFPTANPRQPSSGGFTDAFVTKLNSAGSALVYSTYHGGNGTDQGRGIAVDGSGNAYVTGNTGSSNFPTASAIQPAAGGSNDAFATKLNSIGSALIYSTYIGGSGSDVGRGISVDVVGQTYVTGETSSTNFPTASPLQSANGGGTDAFVTKLNSVGTGFVYSTYLGGNSTDQAFGIAADAAGNAYVIGQTSSLNFPVRSAQQPSMTVSPDAFVTKFNSVGSAFIYSTYLGGNSSDQGRGIVVDSLGNPYLTGLTFSTNFPTAGPFQSTNRGSFDAFVAKLGPAADLSITMTDSPDPVTTGSNLTYTITATDNGELNATGVKVTDPLPPSVTFVSAVSSQGSCTQSSGTVTCNLGNLNNGSSATVTIVVTPTAIATLTNTATVIANEPDPNPANNTATQTTSVNLTDLSVTMTDSPDPIDSGANLTYTIPVRNNGPQQAVNVVLTDTLPPGAAFVSANSTQGNCNQASGTVTCSIGTLANGATATVTIVVIPTRGTITNTARVTADNPDLNTANNTAFQTTTVNGPRTNPDSKGTDFWLAFEVNYTDVPTLSLFITGDVDTAGTVSIPGTGFSTNFTVTAGLVTTVIVPPDTEVKNSDGIENKGIHVTSLDEVSVYGLNRIPFTTDAYLGLPVKILGTSYIPFSYGGGFGAQFAVVATADATTVTVTPSVATSSRSAGAPYNVTLNQGQVYQLINTLGTDLSGSIVTSDKPIAVFASNGCVAFPSGFCCCDHIVEQMTPTQTWGKSFVTIPLATRLNGDTFRFLASTNGTTVSVNGSIVATLNRGQFHERIINGPAQITSNQPILVAQYSNSTGYDGVTSDPFMMLIPPYEQFLNKYTVTTPASGFNPNFINVVASTTAVGTITLDGTAIPSGSFVPIGSSGFSGAQVAVSSGSHRLLGALPFGAFVYGFASFDSYGYPGGLSLAPIAQVTSVALAPKTSSSNVGTQQCFVATVKDQNTSPIADIRVDFSVTGANQTTGFATTNTSGQAQFCYTGGNSGTDTIVASVGNISDNATRTWLAIGVGGRVTDPGNNGISGVVVTLSGTLTRVVQTDANGNYSFNDLVGGGNYSAVASSALFVFNPPRFDFTNLTANQTANFAQAPNAVPSPTPPPSDDFNGAQRDPQKWNLGTATQPAGAFDPQITVAQTSGQLVITPRANVNGPHYNGYVSVSSFDMRNGSASVELVKAATGGADTIFAVGTDADNFFRFLVHTPGAPTSLAPMTRGEDGIARPLDTTTAQLIFQVKIGGQLNPDPPNSIPYDPVQHRFLRFRHEPATNSIAFETSPNVDFSPISFQQSVPLTKGVSALTAELSAGTSSPTNPGQAIFDNFNLVTSTFQFSAGSYTVGEADSSVLIAVTRAGSTGTAATVDYATADGTASQRNKYLPTVGTLRFAAGETIKSFQVLIEDNLLVEGNQTVNLLLGNPVGSGLNSPGRAVLTIVDNDTVQHTVNPLNDATFFAHQHYLDFLNRQPDANGLAFWANEISLCGTDQTCLDNKRINVSAAFFLSIEFQDTGYLVERIYKAAYGDAGGSSTFGGAHQLPVPIIRLNEFLPDTQEIGQGIVVGQGNWQQQLEDNKNAFTAEFVQRPRFTTAFSTTLTPAQFVDKLFTNAGVTPSASDRTAAINEFGAATTTSDTAARARALRKVAENVTLTTNEFNRAFVLMQYFGYLRRNPNDPQDTDYTGYDFWLTKLNNFTQPGDAVLVRVQKAEMVKAFIVSTEYRSRFGP